MKIEILDGVDSWASRRDEWNALASECSDDVSLTFEWHQALAVSQAKSEPLRAVWASSDRGAEAILPLRMEKTRLRGVPLRQIGPLGSLYSAHDCLLVRGNSLEALDGVLRAAKGVLPSWDVFRFSVSGDSPIYAEIDALARSGDARLEWSQAKQSPYLPLPGTFDEFWAGLSTKRRTSIRSRVKKFKEQGEPTLRVITQPSEISEVMEIILGIERASWKENEGTSITANPYQVVFYEVLTRELAERGWLRMYLLYLGDRPVAHDIGFRYKNRFFSGKTSFLEELRPLQPGYVLRWMILQDLYAIGVREHDFMGDPDPYKLHWTDAMRDHRDVRWFRQGARAGLVRMLRMGRGKNQGETPSPTRADPT
ncbi:MAG TPA: GNAT family N-acetyltransferase [Candidatus Eisenbacteria bacterium]|nr:GNAT family N-acetyltransferase [Candidatus Eisenbacteria bacterium]